MPTQKYDVSILFNVASNNVNAIDDILKKFEDLDGIGKAVLKTFGKLSDGFVKSDIDAFKLLSKIKEEGKQVADVFGKLARNIGGTDSLATILLQLDQIKKRADSGADLNVKTNLRELEIYLSRLENISKLAEKTDNVELFRSIQTSVNSTKELLDYLRQLEKVSLNKNVDAYKSLLDEVSTKIKSATKEADLLFKVTGSSTDLKPYISQLEEARSNLQFLRKEAEELGQSTTKIDSQIAALNANIQRFSTGKPPELASLKSLDQVIDAIDKIEKDAKSGIKLEFEIPKAEFSELRRNLTELQREAIKTQNIELFQDTVSAFDRLKNVESDLKRIAQIPVDRSAAALKIELDNISKEITEITKQSRNLIETGADVAEIKKFEAELTNSIIKLKELRDRAETVGINTKAINVKILNAEQTLTNLKNINQLTLDNARKNIELKVKVGNELKGAIQDLKTLNELLNQAVEKRDFKAIPDLRRRFNEVRAQQQQLLPQIKNSGQKAQINAFTGFTQGLDSAKEKLDSFSKDGGRGLVLAFNRVGASFRNAFADAGGTNAVIRALAGTFRLIGTSAFVVGGELRTLGFGFGALGSLIQNFGPLLASLASSFGILSVPLVAIGGYLFILSTQLLAFGGILASVAKAGLQFNDEFARTRNSISGIVGLFFDVKKNGQDVGVGLDDVAAAQAKLAATSNVVSTELRQLSQEALTTEFTTSELFAAFNATVTSGSKLAPNLQALTILTGGLARVASVAGVSAANLSSSITQLISGTGRVTNPLQRFFNQIKDSKGIELTAKRIKELRKSGTLLGELLAVTNKFSALGEEQAKTLSGSFSNIVDAFQLFSGLATQKAYDVLRNGFTNIKNLVTEQVDATVVDNQGKIEKIFDATGKAVKITQFKEPILVLAQIFDNLFEKISKDFIALLNRVGNYIISFADYLKNNSSLLDDIYDAAIQIADVFLQIVADVYGFIQYLANAKTGLEVIRNIAIGIALSLLDVRAVMYGILKVIYLIAEGAAFLGKLDPFERFKKSTYTDDKLREFKNNLLDVDVELGLIAEQQKRLKDIENSPITPFKLDTSVNSIKDIYKLVKNLFNSTDTEEKKSSKDKAKSLLGDRKQYADAVINLSKATEDIQLDNIKDSLAKQQDLVKQQLEFNVISQEASTKRILELKKQELDAETKNKQNDIARARLRQQLLEVGFKQEENQINKQVTKPNERKGRLDEVELNRQTSRIKFAEEVKKIESEILQIKQRQLTIELEALQAQFQRSQELLKQNQELRRSVTDLLSKTSSEFFAASQQNTIAEQADELRKLKTAFDELKPSQFANLGFVGGLKAFSDTKKLLEDNISLLEKQIQLKLQAQRFDFVQNVYQARQNELRLKEDNIQQDLNTGQITEREAAVRIATIRKQIVEALKLANAELEKTGLLTEEQQATFNQNLLEIRKLSEELPDSGILDVTKTIGDSFNTFFENLQEDITDAKSAFASLAQSILGSFRKLIAQRISEALFENILAPKGKVAGVLESLGLSKQKGIDAEAAARAANEKNPALIATEGSLQGNKKDFKDILKDVNKDFEDKTSVFKQALDSLSEKINKTVAGIDVFNPKQAQLQADQAAAFNVLNSATLNLKLFGTDLNIAVSTLNELVSRLLSAGSVSSSYQLDIPQEAKGGLVKYFANGGLALGKDVIPSYLSNGEFVITPDMVKKLGLPLLNYINKFGALPKLAGGGNIFNSYGTAGASSFGSNLSFLGGGATAIQKLAPIVEQITSPVKKKGGLRNILGNILSFAAPFLNFIPVIGPFLALGAGAAGGALTGSTKGKLGGILGGIFGGLSNLSGFGKAGGLLGSLSRGVGSSNGQLGLSLFGNLFGNAGGALGKSSLGLFKSGNLQNIFGNLSGSNFLSKLFGFFDIFKFGKLFNLSGILGKKDGGLIPRFASGGNADLGKLLALFTAVSSISSVFKNSGSTSDYIEEIVSDPDAQRKNLFGSAYAPLIGANFIPDFKYSEETLQKLRNQFNGIKNLIKVPKQGILSKLGQILPALLSLFSLGSSKSSSSTGNTDILKNFAATGAARFASGGLANYVGGGKVRGAGTSTSDSILSLISPESFILKAASVKELEYSLLESIAGQMFSFNEGGSASQAMLGSLGELSAAPVTTNANVSIHNYNDMESAIEGYLSSKRGSKHILNVLNVNRNSASKIISRGRRN